MNETLQASIVAIVLGVCALFILRHVKKTFRRDKCRKPKNNCAGCDTDCPLKK